MNAMTTLSIVIVNYNAQRHLENCLGSLASSPPAIGHEIVVVDNAYRQAAPCPGGTGRRDRGRAAARFLTVTREP
jgi:hypothetical protein